MVFIPVRSCISLLFFFFLSNSDGDLLENYLPHLLTTTTRPNEDDNLRLTQVCVYLCVCVEIKCLSCRCGGVCNISNDWRTLQTQFATRWQLAVCSGVSIISPTLCLFAAKFGLSTPRLLLFPLRLLFSTKSIDNC